MKELGLEVGVVNSHELLSGISQLMESMSGS